MRKPRRYKKGDKVYIAHTRVNALGFIYEAEVLPGIIKNQGYRYSHYVKITKVAHFYSGCEVSDTSSRIFPRTPEGKMAAQKLVRKACRKELSKHQSRIKELQRMIGANQ